MKARHLVRVAFTLVLAQSALVVSAASPVDPSISSISTAGHWEHSGRSGTFRVVLSQDGFEHINTTVVAEWVEVSSTAPQPNIVATTRELLRNYLAAFEAPELKVYPDRVQVTLKGVLTQIPEGKVTCVFELLGDGTVRVVRKCS